MEYLDGCSITGRYVVRKVAAMESSLYNLEIVSLWEYNFQIGGLAYDRS